MDPGPRWIYGFTFGCILGPLSLVVAHALLWEFREGWWEAPNDDDMQYADLMGYLILGDGILFIPSLFVSGWVSATLADAKRQ